MSPSRRLMTALALCCLTGLVQAAPVAKPAPPPAKPAPKPTPAPAPPAPTGPAAEKAELLREAARNLDKAASALAKGQRSLAEQFFSFAENIVGPDALADLAPLFREGAPPRITTPLKKLPMDTPAQPTVVGGSDDDEPEAKPQKGSLTGSIKLEGKGAGESIGVVTLTPTSGKAKKRSPKQRIVEQRGRQFAPHILAVPVGSTVAFPNFDNLYHNVFSLSEPRRFDLGLYKNGESREITFDKEGVVRLGCNLHANMSAWVVVVSAPHYAITDATGKFTFKSLTPGKYKMQAWSERSKAPITQDIVIKAGANDVSASLEAGAAGSTDKFGAPRGQSP